MENDNQKIRHVLEMLASGRTCDYAPVQGSAVMLLDDCSKFESIDVGIVRVLRDQELISIETTLTNWHPFFHPSFQNPVYIYEISDKGREYLERPLSN